MQNSPLYFTKIERVGTVLFGVILVGLLWLPNWWRPTDDVPTAELAALAAEVEDWAADTTIEPTRDTERVSNPTSSPQAATPFDPNAPTRELLAAAGLGNQSIRAWLSYVRKGGQFRKWADVEKFRALSAAERNALRPLLRFPGQPNRLPATDESSSPAVTAVLPAAPFDPHAVTATELQSWGLSQRAARNWTRYTSSGGRFRVAADAGKIYGITEAEVERLLPYIKVPAAEPSANATESSPPKYTPRPVFAGTIDINQATAEEWQQLRGIGPGYSRRITNFRDKLGGFHSVDQVAETYGLPDSTFQAIRPQLTASPVLQLLRINHLSVEELAAHPYVRYREARLIVKYRTEHGPFADFSALGKLYGLQAEQRERMAPYLAFD
ncbi:MAG: helix-hairpin-helix domain-containing protein [Bacteroidota bacterium]